MPQTGEITRLLQESSDGNADALEQLFPLVYDELRSLAKSYLRSERQNHTLQPTALVHEAYLRLVKQENLSIENRTHFFGIAANLMRQVLVNYANARNAEKREGTKTVIALDNAISFFQTQDLDLLNLNEALEKLSNLDKRQAEIVELKFFGGLTNEETADYLKVSVATIKRDWDMAKTWLYRELKTV